MTIWLTTPVDEQPELSLKRWSVIEFECETGRERVLVGYCIENREGRTSQDVLEMDLVSMVFKTKSGRVYRLIGPPGFDTDADYVFGRWCQINDIHDFDDVSKTVWSAHIDAKEALERK